MIILNERDRAFARRLVVIANMDIREAEGLVSDINELKALGVDPDAVLKASIQELTPRANDVLPMEGV